MKDTVELFVSFLTSPSGLFLKAPLILEIASTIDELASLSEMNLVATTGGVLGRGPGSQGAVEEGRVEAVMGIVRPVQ